MTHYLNHFNTSYIEELLDLYRNNPENLDQSWRFFFDGLALGGKNSLNEDSPLAAADLDFEIKVLELIQGYRNMAYLIADVDPLNRGVKSHPLLELKNFGLNESDLDRVTRLGKVIGLGEVPLREIVSKLREIYCSPVAVETGHIEDPKSRHWVQTLVESRFLAKPLDTESRQRALDMLTRAETFERFLHKRFVGQKRFSLEGCDVLIPMLDYLITRSSEIEADEILFGMAHRGRLSVLTHIFQKDIRTMFAEFSGNLENDILPGDGDVKYHMGYSIDLKTHAGREMHLSLAPNPSHLEAVNAVVMGMARSKQKIKEDVDRKRTLVVLLHGDASFAGQGSVYEALNMSALRGYNIGGTIHVIVNNQVGFTTDPVDARSTLNATDLAKMLQIPIFRVNADETEAALRCVDLAVQYRANFKRDVVIDLVGYRRFGHNEGDEPAFTQPVMTAKIAAHATARQKYVEKLVQEKIIESAEADRLVDSLIQEYDAALDEAKKSKYSAKMSAFGKRWTGFTGIPKNDEVFEPVNTRLSIEKLKDIATRLSEVPSEIELHPKAARLVAERREMAEGKRGVDWGFGEAMAFASLLKDGNAVRLAGQDVKRGTFSHRHAVFFDARTGEEFSPINRFRNGLTDFEAVNSLLSEYAALAFEVGQSWANPYKLTLWEAQFGDFANGAQIIIDQFVASAAFKWQRHSGLVMLLPHGYEGQGPEHSSARIERFLQACAQNNIQVCNLTTPAQYFHALRRQLTRNFRIPLIVATPKSLLRHPLAVSSFADFTDKVFEEVIDDASFAGKKEGVNRLVLCSGKVYYDLVKAREKSGIKNAAIVRVEQYYPFPHQKLKTIIHSYPNASDIIWCQEEPENMGGWTFIKMNLDALLDKRHALRYVGRPSQASPAHGYMHIHQGEQDKIAQTALGAE